MNAPLTSALEPPLPGERIRVRGMVQGVGFRPTVWRIAQALGVRGSVANDGEGVLIEAWGAAAVLHALIERIRSEAPPLARIESIERGAALAHAAPDDFRIVASSRRAARTQVAPDAATCAACVAEIFDPFGRRFRYPFTNCTHCGPRFSIIQQIPYDRSHTTMADFALCPACAAEYADPADRRFHAQPIACYACGPRVSLRRSDGRAIALDSLTFLDDADAACSLLQRGHIVAIKGLGGYQLACDATHADAVARLRLAKQRARKPLAMMARDLEVIRHYAQVGEQEAALLSSPAAPIVLLQRLPESATPALDAAVAPGMNTLGFMLPNTPLHHLMLRRMQRPIVLTSGNLSDEPQAISAEDASARLGQIAEYFLEHNRPIARRVDDSVTRVVAGHTRLLRRARGYAPAPIPLPPGFEHAPRVLAYGSELKNTFCLLHAGSAVLSSHIGDLDGALTRADYRTALADFHHFFEFEPERLACDLHPGYAATQLALAQSVQTGLPLDTSQHHHAHLAACLADNGVPLHAAPVLGVVLDGIGYGEDGTLWGGEFMLADYRGYQRLGTFKPVALIGGDAAAREPWRNTYAHLMAEMGWPVLAMNFAELALFRFLEQQPRTLLDGMLRQQLNAPLASSCGRLFDAVAAAIGVAREHAHYEGQGAVELEAAADRDCLENEAAELDYPFAIPLLRGSKLPYIEPLAMWQALLGDMLLGTPVGVMSARFHRGLAQVIVKMVDKLASRISQDDQPLPQVALSGGVFQNRILFERVLNGLESRGFTVLSHHQVPCNDGGLALGQAVIAAARQLPPHQGETSCV
jgi:hydrogenase maturation protein HypF